MGNVLGILSISPTAYFDSKRSQAIDKASIDPARVEELLNERTEARKAKDWEKADRIRKKLADMNIIIEDRSDGSVWKIGD